MLLYHIDMDIGKCLYCKEEKELRKYSVINPLTGEVVGSNIMCEDCAGLLPYQED